MTVNVKPLSTPNEKNTSEESLTINQLIEKKRYQTLKYLLLAEEYERLNHLEYSINHPDAHAEKIAPSLPQAIKLSNLDSVYQALELNTLVQDKIIESVQNDTEMYTEALFPVILPAIKKSIAEAFKEMMQSLNYAIEQGLSLNRIGWHVEALFSGVPYREIILRHTLTYQVEQVFLIHRETGLLMRHVSSKNSEQLRDSDAVSAMLTALQDFIQDSFSVNEHDYLDTIEIGDYTVFLTRDSNAVLACVTQGIAPYSLREIFNDTLQNLTKNYNDALKNFEGDSSTLESADQILKTCLVSEIKDTFKKKDPSIKNFAIVLLLILIGIGYWRYDYWKFQQQGDSYIAAVEHATGIIIAEHHYEGKKLFINGLYDPLADNPQKLISQFGLKEKQVISHWQIYLSLEPFFVEQRVTKLLHPPAFVTLHVKNNTVVLAGVADKNWIENLKSFIPASVGLTEINTQALKTYEQAIIEILQPPPTITLHFENSHLLLTGIAHFDWMQTLSPKLTSLPFLHSYSSQHVVIQEDLRFQQLVTQLETLYIYFVQGKAIPKNTQEKELYAMTNMIKELQKLSLYLNKPIELIIIGQSDQTSTPQFNEDLAQARAEYIMEQLKNKGVSISLKKSIKIGKSKLDRKTSLKVVFQEIDKL